MTFRHEVKQSPQVDGTDDFQKFVGGIAFGAYYFSSGVVERNATLCEQPFDVVKAICARQLVIKPLFVVKKYKSHNAPEIILTVGVIEVHAPAVRSGRECAHNKNFGVRRDEWGPRVGFGVHVRTVVLYGC